MSEDAPLDLATLKLRLREFARERDWEQFHNPKNLSMALAAEAGELLEIFQWLSDDQSSSLGEADRRLAREEIADILIYIVRIADQLDLNLASAVEDKLMANAAKYPVDLAKGNATKYSRRDQ